MEAYILLCTTIILIFIFIRDKNFNKIGIPLVLICLTLFFGLRDSLAIDDASYINIFKDIKIGNPVYVEETFVLISKIAQDVLNMNYKFVFFTYAVFSFIFINLIMQKLEIKKYKFWIFILSFIAFCLTPYLNAMRQFLASAIFVYSLLLFNEKKYLKTFALMIIAGLIHNSAFILILFFPIFSDKVKFGNKMKIIIPFLAILLGNTSIIQNFVLFILQKLNLGYTNYITDASDAGLTNSGLLIYLLYVVYALQFIFRKKDSEKYDNIIEKGEMLFFVTFFATQGLGFARRISYFFMIFECFVFITLLKCTNEPKNKTNLIVLISLAIIAFMGYGMINTTSNMSFENFSLDFWS